MKTNLSILCVEDDKEALEDITYLLKKSFDEIYEATDGSMALDIFNTKTPDIILLDINIPKIDGLKVAENIRKVSPNIPIVFLSAHSEKEKLLKAINLKVSSYIIKPFKINELKETLFKIAKELNKCNNIIDLGNNFIFNSENEELFYNQIEIPLTKNESSLILLLLKNKSRFLTVQEISFDIGTSENDYTGNNVVQLISRFKKKLQKQIGTDSFFIENTYGSGYKIK